jgi:hypothetical protein
MLIECAGTLTSDPLLRSDLGDLRGVIGLQLGTRANPHKVPLLAATEVAGATSARGGGDAGLCGRPSRISLVWWRN